jgi:hypothetical protein
VIFSGKNGQYEKHFWTKIFGGLKMASSAAAELVVVTGLWAKWNEKGKKDGENGQGIDIFMGANGCADEGDNQRGKCGNEWDMEGIKREKVVGQPPAEPVKKDQGKGKVPLISEENSLN